MAVDPPHKRRSACTIEDEALRQACQTRIARRLVPQIARRFRFTATGMK